MSSRQHHPRTEPSTFTARPGPIAAFGAALVIVATALGVLVSTVGSRATGEVGLDVLLSHHRQALLTQAAHVIEFGVGPTLAPVVLIVMLALVAIVTRRGAIVMALAVVVGWSTVWLARIVFNRPGPPADHVHSVAHQYSLDSYPSGHTAFTVAVVAGLVMALRVAGRRTGWVWWVGVPLVVTVGVSRLYLGAHYLGDVLGALFYVAGSVLLLSAALSLAVAHWPGRRVLDASTDRPSVARSQEPEL